jgi:hypothetical protein
MLRKLLAVIVLSAAPAAWLAATAAATAATAAGGAAAPSAASAGADEPAPPCTSRDCAPADQPPAGPITYAQPSGFAQRA